MSHPGNWRRMPFCRGRRRSTACTQALATTVQVRQAFCRRYRHQIMLGIACCGCSLDIDTRSVRRNKCNNATASTALSVASFLVCMVLGAPGLGGSRPPVRAIVNATVMSGCAHSAWFSVASAAAYVRKTVAHAPPCKACGCAAVHFGLNLVSSGRDAQQG